MKLHYGMKLKDLLGEILSVEKYWPDDEDANAYKVKFGGQSFYSSDLIFYIKKGDLVVVD